MSTNKDEYYQTLVREGRMKRELEEKLKALGYKGHADEFGHFTVEKI